MIFINIIDAINKIFTTREQAITIWIIIALIYCISKEEIRTSLKQVVKAMNKVLLTIPMIFMIMYILLFGVFLHKVGYLKYTIIKDYIIWGIFGLFPIIINVIEKYKTITLLEIIRDTVKFSIIPLFIINNYTMNIFVELIIIPLAFICNMCIVICGSKEEYEPAKKILNIVLIVISVLIIYSGIRGFVSHIDDLKSILFWESLGMDIIGVIGFIPVILFFRYYMLYEQITIRIVCRSDLNKFIICMIIFKNCLLSKKKLLCILNNINFFYRIVDWRDLDNRIKANLNKVYEVA